MHILLQIETNPLKCVLVFFFNDLGEFETEIILPRLFYKMADILISTVQSHVRVRKVRYKRIIFSRHLAEHATDCKLHTEGNVQFSLNFTLFFFQKHKALK